MNQITKHSTSYIVSNGPCTCFETCTIGFANLCKSLQISPPFFATVSCPDPEFTCAQFTTHCMKTEDVAACWLMTVSAGESRTNIIQSFWSLCLVLLYLSWNYLFLRLDFSENDHNEYQMKKASKKSIELQTAYVYRKNTPRRHHYSGKEKKGAIVKIFPCHNLLTYANLDIVS